MCPDAAQAGRSRLRETSLSTCSAASGITPEGKANAVTTLRSRCDLRLISFPVQAFGRCGERKDPDCYRGTVRSSDSVPLRLSNSHSTRAAMHRVWTARRSWLTQTAAVKHGSSGNQVHRRLDLRQKRPSPHLSGVSKIRVPVSCDLDER